MAAARRQILSPLADTKSRCYEQEEFVEVVKAENNGTVTLGVGASNQKKIPLLAPPQRHFSARGAPDYVPRGGCAWTSAAKRRYPRTCRAPRTGREPAVTTPTASRRVLAPTLRPAFLMRPCSKKPSTYKKKRSQKFSHGYICLFSSLYLGERASKRNEESAFQCLAPE